MFMHILTIDRLSRTLVVDGLIFVALGLVIAFLKSDRVHDTDGVTFWICAIVTIFGLVLVAWLTCNEANVRVAGLFFQVAGIVVALYALQDVRAKLDQPGLIAALTEFVEKPFKGQSINLTEEGAHLQGSASSTTEAHGTLTTHPKSLFSAPRATPKLRRHSTRSKFQASTGPNWATLNTLFEVASVFQPTWLLHQGLSS
jgi:hypothetical protein